MGGELTRRDADQHDHKHDQKGENMTNKPEAKKILDRASLVDTLRPFANPEDTGEGSCVVCIDERAVGTGKPESMFRNPGSFILDFANGSMDLAAIKEHVEKSGITVITSHDGCGAAGLVYGMMTNDKKVSAKILDFLNDGESAKIGFAHIENSDHLGKLWSNKLARVCGLDYDHLEIDAPEHYASMALVDLAGLFKGNTLKSGAFIAHQYSMGVLSQEVVIDHLVDHAVLSENIARGKHSVLKPEDTFWIPIVINEDQVDMANDIKERILNSGKLSAQDKTQIEIITASEFSPAR